LAICIYSGDIYLYLRSLFVCRGGYLVRPTSVEFWQGQSDRLHDRIVFRRPQPNEVIDESVTKLGDDGWVYERLCP